MTSGDKMPQWLKEVMDRGFKPNKIYNLPDGLFSYTKPGDSVLRTHPNKLIFTLEGIPGSGKTSILDSCRDREIECIDQILPVEPKSEQPVEYFLESEELKTLSVLQSNRKISLLDRYYVSTLAYYWASDKITGSCIYSKVLSWYQKAINSGAIIKPFTVFLIHTPIDKSFIRKNRQADINSGNMWLSPDFLNYCEEYNNYFYTHIEPHTNTVSIDGSCELCVIAEEIRSYISKYG
jgi:thymidylate kinase